MSSGTTFLYSVVLTANKAKTQMVD